MKTTESTSRTDEDLIARVDSLLKVDTDSFKPRLRIRWWNIAILTLAAVGVLSLIAPLAWPETKDGLWGNVLAETWGILASAGIAWVAFNRFRTERLTKATFTLFDDVRELRRLVLVVYPRAINARPGESVSLTKEERDDFRGLASLIFSRAALFNRHLEVEELEALDKCATSAFHLANADGTSASAESAHHEVTWLLRLYLSSSLLTDAGYSQEIVDGFNAARKLHMDLWQQEIRSR